VSGARGVARISAPWSGDDRKLRGPGGRQRAEAHPFVDNDDIRPYHTVPYGCGDTSPKWNVDTRLTREDWLRAARLALLNKGPAAVRVEPLARELGVTKGSFYWHFAGRKALLEALIAEWEEEETLITEAIHRTDRSAAIQALIAEVKQRTLASERGEAPSDAAIFAWGAIDPEIAERTRHGEEQRMQLLRELVGNHDVADFFYYAYHGLLLRRRRVPEAAADFDRLARMWLLLVEGDGGPGRPDSAERTPALLPASALRKKREK
jgi:AcrR family transcriptional regulator